jgi:hypothetical protein
MYTHTHAQTHTHTNTHMYVCERVSVCGYIHVKRDLVPRQRDLLIRPNQLQVATKAFDARNANDRIKVRHGGLQRARIP